MCDPKKKSKQPHLSQKSCLKKSQRSLMLAEASQVLSLLTPCIPPAVRGPSTFFDFHRLKTSGETSEIAIKVLEGEMHRDGRAPAILLFLWGHKFHIFSLPCVHKMQTDPSTGTAGQEDACSWCTCGMCQL